jgi:alpha-N-arabinofuranosidase
LAGKPVVALYTRDAADADTLVAAAPVSTSSPMTLTIRITGGTMAFDYGFGGKTRTLKQGGDATLLSTKKAGGFVGTIVGPYHYTPAS